MTYAAINLRWHGWFPPESRPRSVKIVTHEGAMYDFVNVLDNDGIGRFGQIVEVEFRELRAPRRWWQLRGRLYTRRRVKVSFGVNRRQP